MGRHYDLVITADILEHFAAADAVVFLERCLVVGAIVLIANTAHLFDQESGENPL